MHSISSVPAAGYVYEGISAHLFSESAPGLVALHSVYSPSHTDHMPTTNPQEGASYNHEGILGHCSAVWTPETPNAFLRAVHSGDYQDHFCTHSTAEIAAFPPAWAVEQTTCFVP